MLAQRESYVVEQRSINDRVVAAFDDLVATPQFADVERVGQQLAERRLVEGPRNG